jgi:hypothetical protein
MTWDVPRRVTEKSENVEERLVRIAPRSCTTASWALDWDVFESRYGSARDGQDSEDIGGECCSHDIDDGLADFADEALNQCSAFEYGCHQPEPVSTPCQMVLSSVMSHVSEYYNCSPWMIPKSQLRRNKLKKNVNNPRLLFQYKPYELQEPLSLSEDEMAGVVAAVFSDESSTLHEAKNAAIVILIKVVMDVYVEKGGDETFEQVASLLRRPLVRMDGSEMSRCATFDIIANLIIHGELLTGGASDLNEDVLGANVAWARTTVWEESGDKHITGKQLAFLNWLRRILFDLLMHLVSSDESSSSVWSSAASCLIALCTRDGFVVKDYIETFPLQAARRMLQVARLRSWDTKLKSLFACIACNILYDDDGVLDPAKLDAFGGVRGVVQEYQYAPSLIAQRGFFCVLLDALNVERGISRAMLRCSAAEVLRDYLVLPAMISDQDTNENLAKVVYSAFISLKRQDSVDNKDITFDNAMSCIKTLKDVASQWCDMPQELVETFAATCEAGIFGQSRSENWNRLKDKLTSSNPQDVSVGRCWMVKLMMTVLDAGVREKNPIMPPPLPLLPSDSSEHVLATFGDTILSCFLQQGNMDLVKPQYDSYLGDAKFVTNFALAVQNVVRGIRFRTLLVEGDLHSTWKLSNVDVDRLCISMIERAFEWILGFSNCTDWGLAVALLAEMLVDVTTAGSQMRYLADTNENTDQNPVSTPRKTSEHSASTSPERQSTDGRPLVPALHIPSPSPSKTSPESVGPLSPLTKIVPNLWRRLKTPGSRSNTQIRPSSGESQGSNPESSSTHIQRESRPLSAGIVAMEVYDGAKASSRPKEILTGSISTNDQVPASRIGSITAQTQNTQWVSIAKKIHQIKTLQDKEDQDSTRDAREAISLHQGTVNAVESFIAGTSSCSPRLLQMMNAQILKDTFEAIGQVNFDGSPLCVPSARQQAMQSVMAGKPLWDARLALLILLLSSHSIAVENRHKHPLLEDAEYLQALIRDPDLRVRHHACAFMLERFRDSDPEGFIKATRSIVSQAQQTGDETLLTDPEARLNKILDFGITIQV